MSRVTTVDMQFGSATLDTAGESPLIASVTGSEDMTAITITLQSNAGVSPYVVEYPLYIVASSQKDTIDFNYLIVSST